ncbi:MAG: SurA N-terminal domain-containing protein [Akkermansiaceae bacterium]
MLEIFRKYTGLMFVVLILLFVGLVFFGSSGRSSLGGKTVVTAHGRGFTQNDFRRFAVNPTRMLGSLVQATQFRAYQPLNPYLTTIGGSSQNQDQILEFLVNRLSLQKAMKDFGVYPSTAEVETFLKESIFWVDGAFDQQAYLDFEKEELQPLGMTLKDLNEIMGEVLAITQLGEIMGAGVEASRESVLQNYLARDQRVSYQLVNFPLIKYELDQDPAEEDIKAEWEESKGSYLSKHLRKVSFMVASPDYAALEKEKADLLKKEAEAKEAEVKDAEAKDEVKPKPVDDPPVKLTAEERQTAIIKLGGKFDQMLDDLQLNGTSIAELASKYNFTIITTELVTKAALPAQLADDLQDVRNKTGVDVIFESDLNKAKVNRLGTDQWLFFQVLEIIEPKELSYEEARDEVRLNLVRSRAMKAVEKDAKEKHETITEALAGGKTFAEATAALELKPITRRNATALEAGAEMSEFRLCITTNPGELSEVFTEANEDLGINRSIFLLVDKREVYENPNLETVLDTQVDSQKTRNQNMVLYNWFAQQRATAELTLPETN